MYIDNGVVVVNKYIDKVVVVVYIYIDMQEIKR